MYIYTMKNWEQILYLLHLSYVTKSGKFDHLTSLIIHSLLDEGGLTNFELVCKLFSFESNRVNTFQRSKNRVATQICKKGLFSF